VTGEATMIDNNHILAIIESAEKSTRQCPSCGEDTVIVAHDDGSLWIECTSPAKPVLQRLLTLDFGLGHTRREVIDAAQFAA